MGVEASRCNRKELLLLHPVNLIGQSMGDVRQTPSATLELPGLIPCVREKTLYTETSFLGCVEGFVVMLPDVAKLFSSYPRKYYISAVNDDSFPQSVILSPRSAEPWRRPLLMQTSLSGHDLPALLISSHAGESADSARSMGEDSECLQKHRG